MYPVTLAVGLSKWNLVVKTETLKQMPEPRRSDIKDNSIEAYRGISSFHAMIPPIRDDVISGL